MVTFQLEQSQENLTSHSGLVLFGAILEGSQLANKLNQIELPKAKQEPDISHNDVIVSYIGLLVWVKVTMKRLSHFEMMRSDSNFCWI